VDCFGRGDALQERACPSETQCQNTSILTLPLSLRLVVKRSFSGTEIFLANSAQRTYEILGNILPLCAGCNTCICSALLWIIDITANIANVFHFFTSPVFLFIITYNACVRKGFSKIIIIPLKLSKK
jgi:hypothetical protein